MKGVGGKTNTITAKRNINVSTEGLRVLKHDLGREILSAKKTISGGKEEISQGETIKEIIYTSLSNSHISHDPQVCPSVCRSSFVFHTP